MTMSIRSAYTIVSHVSVLFAAAVLFASHAAAEADVPRVQTVTSPGGITAWLVEEHAVPLVAINFAFVGSANQDPAGKSGVANMTSSLLVEGAGDLDSIAFQNVVDDKAIRISYDAGRDNFYGSLKTLTVNLDEAVDLTRATLLEPRFDQSAFERIKTRIITGIRRSSRDPDRIAGRLWSKAAFPDHPYGKPVRGTIESVGAITIDDLRTFHKNIIARDTIMIGVVGDIDAKTLAPLLDKLFGGLPEKASLVDVPQVTPVESARVNATEDVPQTVIRFGGRGIRRSDPDFIAAYVVNHILGGGSFSSRLYGEVREKRGLAYGVYTYLMSYDYAGAYGGGVATQTERAGETLEIILKEIERMASEGPTEEELEAAKAYLIGSYPLRFDTSSKIANQLVQIQLEDLGIDYFDKRNGLIEAITIEDARRVAKRLFGGGGLVIATVGRSS